MAEKKYFNKDLKFLNLSKAKNEKIDLSADDIPNLIPDKILNKWLSNDENPYYKIQKIPFPIIANGIEYEETFFESFINKLNDRPIPGSKAGHSIFWGEKPDTDFILVGGLIESTGDGKGNVYFKNYIPLNGAKNDNERFILENKSDMIHYSLVTVPEIVTETNSNGERKVRAIKSLYSERNDAVEYGTGSMSSEMVTNKFDDEDIGEEQIMDKNELLKVLNGLVENGKITLIEIAKNLGLENQLVNTEHTAAVAVCNALKEAGVEDPLKKIKELQSEIDGNKESIFNSVMTEKYGVSHTEEKPNLLRQYAEGKLVNKSGKDLDAGIEELKKDPIAMNFAAQIADQNSETNDIGRIENKDRETDSDSVVMDY